MDGSNWRAAQVQAQAQAQAQGGGVEGGGAAAGAMDSGDWRTQLLPDSRQRIVNKIMETLKRHLPVSGQEGVQDLKKIAVRFEENIYSNATSTQDYLRKISLKMLTMETKSQPPMQPNPTSSGQNALGPASLDSTAQTGNANAAAWQEEVYEKIKSMKESCLAELIDLYHKIASKVQQHYSLPQRPQNEHIEKLKLFKITLERIVLFLRVNKQDIQHSHKEKLVSVENHISFFLSSNRPRSKPSSSPLQGQSSMQLQQPQSVDGQTNPSMQPIPGSMAAMPQNNLTNLQHNSLSGQNPASSGQNALGPEMTMEATSYEPTSGPEDSDEDAKEEEDGDVSKEDVGEEVVVRKEQNSFVGHKENARVGENMESSSNEAIGRPSVFFK